MVTSLRTVFIALALVFAGCGGGGGGGGGGPANTPPTAFFFLNPPSGAVPITVQFDALSSTDPDGSISNYDWDFGDGTTGSGAFLSHDYSQRGLYTVRLTVTDNRGARSSTTKLIDLDQPPGGVWLGEYESSLIPTTRIYAELDIRGIGVTGVLRDSAGRSNTVSGSVNGMPGAFQLVSTTPGCAGTFTGTANVDPNPPPGLEILNFTFDGTDCDGAHTGGSGTVILQSATVVAWGQVNPTGLTYRDGHLFWSDDSLAPLKKLEIASGDVTPLATRMAWIGSLTLGSNHVQWTDRIGSSGESGCTGAGVVRALMIADADISNPRELAKGDFCGHAAAPRDTYTDGTYAYWVIAGSNESARIERVPLADGASEVLTSPGFGFIGMAIDATHLYWSETAGAGATSIYRCPIDGCGGQPPETILAPDDEITSRTRLALAGDQLIFGNSRIGGVGYEISVLPKDGGTPIKAADSAGPVDRILSDGTTIFWLSNEVLYSVPIGGGAVSVVVPSFFFVEDIALGTDRVYWTDSSFAGGFQDAVYYTAKSGGPVSTLVDGLRPYQLEVDSNGDVVYADGGAWKDSPTGINRVSPAGVVTDSVVGFGGQSLLTVDDQNVYALQGAYLKSVGHDGGAASVVSAASSFIEALDSDGTNIYWLEDPRGDVFSVPADGSADPILVAIGNGSATDMQVSGDYAYWVVANNRLLRAPSNGSGPLETLADDLRFATDLVVDDTHVYVLESDASAITRMTFTGENRTTIGGTGRNFGWFDMTQDANNIYWAKAGTLGGAPKTGGDEMSYPDTTMPNQFAEEWIAVDDRFIYWTEEVYGVIKRVPK